MGLYWAQERYRQLSLNYEYHICGGLSFISYCNQFFLYLTILHLGYTLFLSLCVFSRKNTLVFDIATMNLINGLSEDYLDVIASYTTVAGVAYYIHFD